MISIKLNYPDLFCVVYDNNVRFEHEGRLLGLLNDNGKINWFGESKELKQPIKKECKAFITDILKGKRKLA